MLAADEGTDIIEDFGNGKDSLGLANGLTFGQLTIRQKNDHTTISMDNNSEVLAILSGIDFSSINAKDFTTLL